MVPLTLELSKYLKWKSWRAWKSVLFLSLSLSFFFSFLDIYLDPNSQILCVMCILLVAQSCLTLCDSKKPGSSIHEIYQAKIVEWVAISFPGGLPIPGIEPGSNLPFCGHSVPMRFPNTVLFFRVLSTLSQFVCTLGLYFTLKWEKNKWTKTTAEYCQSSPKGFASWAVFSF